MLPAIEIDRLFDRLAAQPDALAIVESGHAYSYADLVAVVAEQDVWLDGLEVKPGDVMAIQSGFSLNAIGLMFALFRRGCVVAFLGTSAIDVDTPLDDAGAAGLFSVDEGRFVFAVRPKLNRAVHPLLKQLSDARRSGIILFSSGSTGRPKAILHDLGQFLVGYKRANIALKTVAFLLFDHVAGLDTLLYTLHAGGSLILPTERNPDAVCALIERWQVEVLPVSPSFLKMLCLSGAAERYDLSSLRIVTYGSEPMDEATMARVAALLPNAKFRQKYGASEFGAPRVRTRQDGLWIRMDGGDTATRVIDGLLWLRAPAAMLGYLNADPPIMQDGWLCTGDMVDLDGGWMRILGRQSDIINVGGQKVYPSEVESVIGELDDVAQVAVSGESHPILGQIVTASVRPVDIEVVAAKLRIAITTHCARHLERHKIPVRIRITADILTGERHKIMRG